MRKLFNAAAAMATAMALMSTGLSPASAADTYTLSRNCVETKTPRAYTPLSSASGADKILHSWTGDGGYVTYGWTSTKVWDRTTTYLKGRIGTITAQTQTGGVFLDSAASVVCVTNPV